MRAWHSILPNEPFVFHDHPDCTLGDNIQPEYLAHGTDGRKRCAQCEERWLRVGALVDLGRPRRLGSAAREYEAGGDPLGAIAPRTASRMYDTGGDPLGAGAIVSPRLGRAADVYGDPLAYADDCDPLADIIPAPGRILGPSRLD